MSGFSTWAKEALLPEAQPAGSRRRAKEGGGGVQALGLRILDLGFGLGV